MTHRRLSPELVLAVFPSTRGFGYAVFEGPTSRVDWGVKAVRRRQKNLASLRKIRELLAFYQPDALIVENYQGRGSRRAKRIQALINLMTAHAADQRIRTVSYSRSEVRASFGLTTKREIAEAIVREFPALEPRLPPVRKIWMSEDARMNIFDAAALAITFFDTKSRAKQAA
jgi:hypothetical protein